MSKQAEQAALKAYPKEIRDKTGFVIDIGHPQWIRDYYIQGYEQAEKDTIERLVSWLIKNVDYYIGGKEVSGCLPIKYHVSCACWADLKAFIEEEQ